ncbi:MAG TPA: hypothetical protein VER17_02850 [Tepidisphaeraceae bacterium]|nr:hypothetical protein [Tepidisphaeraceae bacterium]
MNRNGLFERVAVVALIAFIASALRAQTLPAVHASPADVVAACRAAHERGDIAAELDCFGPTGQAAMIKMLMTGFTAAPATLPAGKAPDPEKAAFEAKHRLDRRQQRPGESREAFAARLTSELPDQRAFLLDFMTHQRAYAQRRRAPAATAPAATAPAATAGAGAGAGAAASTQPATKPAAPQLQDVRIDPSGTSATAKLTNTDQHGGTWSQTVKFEKVNGSWRIASLMMF